MTIRVEVCEADIAAGTPGMTLGCPVALAIKRVLPDCGVIVDRETITFGVRGDHIRWLDFRCPPAVKRFVTEFDARRTVGPFTFDIPDPRAPR